MNKVILKGRLARDVDLRTTNTGKSVAQVSIAVDRMNREQGADFIPLVIWGQQAETFARYLFKGREVLVEGRMQVRSYDDKNGNKRYVTEVVVERFEFCGSRADSENNGGAPSYDGGNGGYSNGGGYNNNNSFNGGASQPAGNGFVTNDGFGQAMPDDTDIPF